MAEERSAYCVEINGRSICLRQGDITEQGDDAIVNAANRQLQLGAGVAGAIRLKGGPEIQQECDRIGGTSVGTAVLTTAGNLRAGAVIHAVGPRQGEGSEEVKLAGATRSALEVAQKQQFKTISFPAISTGIFGFSVGAAARIMLAQIRKHLMTETSLTTVTVCLFTPDDYQVFKRELSRQIGAAD